MTAGVPDFEPDTGEFSDFEWEFLAQGHDVHDPYVLLAEASIHSLGWPSGVACTEGPVYSSASYIFAGYILLAAQARYRGVLLDPLEWRELAMRRALGMGTEEYPSLSYLTGYGRMKDILTIPGLSHGKEGNVTQIWEQNPSVFGYTSGNMVGRTSDVAKYVYDLFRSRRGQPILSSASTEEMMRFALADGYAKDDEMTYSAGLMQFPRWKRCGGVVGHSGMTWVFQSLQFLIPSLGVVVSIAINSDNRKDFGVLTEIKKVILANWEDSTADGRPNEDEAVVESDINFLRH